MRWTVPVYQRNSSILAKGYAAHACDMMPVKEVVAYRSDHDYALVVKAMPDLKAPMLTRFCPDSAALKRRTVRERRAALDAMEARSTLMVPA